jgi:hypothetical protein
MSMVDLRSDIEKIADVIWGLPRDPSFDDCMECARSIKEMIAPADFGLWRPGKVRVSGGRKEDEQGWRHG